MNDAHSFRISISYSGRNRDFVKQVDQELLQYLDHSEIFYDQRYSALMARPDLDGWLRDLFRDGSDLVVCFLSKGHEQSPWCQVESNAVRECFQKNRDAPPPILFTDGKYELGVGFSMDHAQSTEGLTPKQVAEMIIKRFRHDYPNVTVKSPARTGRRFFIELVIVLALLAGAIFLNSNDNFRDSLFNKFIDSNVDNDLTSGIFGFGLFGIALLWGMYRAKSFLSPRDRRAEYVDPPTGSAGHANSNWEGYAQELQAHVDSERKNLAATLLELRQRRHIFMASIFLSIILVAGHSLIWFSFERAENNKDPAEEAQTPSDSSFLPPIRVEARGKDGGMDASAAERVNYWGKSFFEVWEKHQGHRWLATFYLLSVFLFAFVVSNRTKRPFTTAAFLGAWQPLYLGIVYMLFISTYNYSGLFGNSKETSGEPGNFYVIERIVVIPTLCWIVALFAGWLGLMARGKTRPLPAE